MLEATALLQPSGGLLVLAGSRAALEAASSLRARSLSLRQQLLAEGVLKSASETLVFTQDYCFLSATLAAEVIVARSVNAQITWKHPSGRQVRDFLNQGGS